MRLSTIVAMIGIAVCVAGCLGDTGGGVPPPPMILPEAFEPSYTPAPDVVPVVGDLGGDPIDGYGEPPARRDTDPPEHASAPRPTVTLVAETLPPGLFVMPPTPVASMTASQVNQALIAQFD